MVDNQKRKIEKKQMKQKTPKHIDVEETALAAQ